METADQGHDTAQGASQREKPSPDNAGPDPIELILGRLAEVTVAQNFTLALLLHMAYQEKLPQLFSHLLKHYQEGLDQLSRMQPQDLQ